MPPPAPSIAAAPLLRCSALGSRPHLCGLRLSGESRVGGLLELHWPHAMLWERRLLYPSTPAVVVYSTCR